MSMYFAVLLSLFFCVCKGTSEIYSGDSVEGTLGSHSLPDSGWLYTASVFQIYARDGIKLSHTHSSPLFSVTHPGIRSRPYFVGSISGTKIEFYLAKDAGILYFLYAQGNELQMTNLKDCVIDFWQFPGFLLLIDDGIDASTGAINFDSLFYRLVHGLPLGHVSSTVLSILQVTMAPALTFNHSL